MTNQEILRQSTLEFLEITDSLPTLPDRFHKTQEILNDKESSLHDLTKIIETDQATAAAIVKLANSSYLNPIGKPVSNLAYAISRLGRKETGNIALTMSLFYGFYMPASRHIIESFWTHAFAVAEISRHLAKQSPNKDKLEPDTVFLGALLHDIGRAILAIVIDTKYFERNFPSHDEQAMLAEETKAYGLNHAEAGEFILKDWGFPQEIYEIAGSHHQRDSLSEATRICVLANQSARKHLNNISSIEEVQIQLHSGLLAKITEELQPEAVPPTPQL